MTVTSERILNDIKENVHQEMMELLRLDGAFMTWQETEIRTMATDMAHKLKNLCTPGTPAGEAELQLAIEILEQRIAKKMVAELKTKYNI